MYDTGNYTLFKRYYLRSLDSVGNDRHNRQRILFRLSNIYRDSDNKDSAFYFYQRYHEISDSIFNFYSEREFNELFLNYEKEKYQKDIDIKESKILQSKRVIMLVVLILAVIMAALTGLLVVYRRKDRMYTKLVRQHQELLRSREAEREIVPQVDKEDIKARNELDLYGRLEKLMKEDKVYHDTDISLEKLSEMLNTNRTYISNVINKYAKMSFSNYVNSYRIAEAIAVISDPSRDLVLKALYSDVGYNSVSSFYRAFQKETGCSPMVYRDKILKMNRKK